MKLRKKETSTSGRLLFRTAIATFILFAFILIAMYFAINNQFSKTLLKAAEQQLRAKSAEATRYINVRRGQIEIIAKMFEAENIDTKNRVALEQWLNDHMLKNDDDFIDLLYLDREGNLISTTGEVIEFNDKFFGKDLVIGGSYYDYLIKDRKGDSLVTDSIFLTYLKDEPLTFMVFHTVKDANSSIIGAVAAAFKIEGLNKIIDKIDIGYYTLSLMVDSKALTIAHTQREYVGRWNLAQNNEGIKGLSEAARDHMKNPRFEIKEFIAEPFIGFNPTGNDLKITTILMPIEGADNTWEIGTSVPDLSFKLPMYKTMTVVAVVFLLGFIASFILFTLSLRKFNSHINNVANRLSQITNGDGDLRIRIEKLAGKDQLPKLIYNFNEFVETISTIVEDIMQASEELNTYSDAISDASNKMEADMHKQQEEIEEITSNMQQMVASVSEVADYAQNAADTAQSSSDDTKSGAMSVNLVIESIKGQANSINDTASDIEDLQEAGLSIGEVMEVINAIAEQTNLLALNAAIEAARAGDAGRGFAVVADEVRNLAGRTHESTEQISQTVENLRGSIERSALTMRASIEQSNKSVEQANAAGASLSGLTNSIESIEKMNLLIASSTEEQTSMVDDLSVKLGQIVEVSARTNVSAYGVKEKGAKLNDTAHSLRLLINRFKV